MKKTHAVNVIFLSAVLFSSAGWACTAPAAPTLPDPQAAVLAEMVKAQKAVKKYVAAGEEYLKCEKNTAKYNDMVDSMKGIGADFNARIKQFKALKKK